MPEQNDHVNMWDLDAPLPGPEAVVSRSESGTVPSMKADPKPVARKRESGIKQWHILAGVGVVLVVVIVLTSLPSGNHSAQQAPSGVLQPQAAMSSAAHNPERDPEQVIPKPALPPPLAPVEAAPVNAVAAMPSGAQSLPPIPATAPAQTSTTSVTVASGSSEASENVGALAELTAQVGATQTSVKQLTDEVTKLTQQLATSHMASTRRTTSRGSKREQAHAAPRNTTVIRSLTGVPYTINTIGRGYAWLQAGDHVEIVQPGDRIGTTRVLAVDAHDRRVITSDGIIK